MGARVKGKSRLHQDSLTCLVILIVAVLEGMVLIPAQSELVLQWTSVIPAEGPACRSLARGSVEPYQGTKAPKSRPVNGMDEASA